MDIKWLQCYFKKLLSQDSAPELFGHGIEEQRGLQLTKPVSSGVMELF
jgi:hypothetical protein